MLEQNFLTLSTMTRTDFFLLLAAFCLLTFAPRQVPPGGVTVTYGCPGNWMTFKTTNRIYLTVNASNGPAADCVYGVYSVPLYPLRQVFKTNSL